MTIDIISVSDKGGLDRVYMLLNSIKQNKQQDTIINYRVITDDTSKQYFEDLQSDDFHIELINIEWFKQRIKPPREVYFYYVRLLFPTYFTQLDKVLYLDNDLIFVKEGIEELWNTDISNYSIAAVSDIPVNTFSGLQKERERTGSIDYFNSGVCLFNLKKMRQNQKDQQLANWCLNWNINKLFPQIMDQTLLNYMFKNDVLYLDYKFNDYSLVLSKVVYNGTKEVLKKQYGYNQPIDSLKNAIVIHFLGTAKPWKNTNEERLYHYGSIIRSQWNKLKEKYSKREIQ